MVWQLFGQIGQIAGQRIAHLDGPFQFGGSLLQYDSEVLPGMPVAREEQGDPASCED